MAASLGKIALVTGAGSGIGRASALALHAGGFTVVLVGRRLAALEATRDSVGEGRDRLVPIVADISDANAVDALFADIAKRFGRLDVLFNNAGWFPKPTPFEDVSLANWQAAVAVNLTGAFLVAQAAYRQMKAQVPQGGRIINNGSISAHVPRPNSGPYTITKHAIAGLTRQIALDGRPFAIAASQIDVGNAATDLTAPMAAGLLQADGSVRPEACMDVAHVAEAVAYMAELPLSANVLFMTLMATQMPYVGRG
jgi:NAD(P)-dependent dehydrogenase (short-subunit alcohol dehydrogenase family)